METTHIWENRKGNQDGLCNVVSLTGAVAFEKVTKVRIRQVHVDLDPQWSVRIYTCQTVRMTIRAGIESVFRYSVGRP